MSLFEGGFTFEGALSACGGKPDIVLEVLETLVDSSLLHSYDGRAGTRYAMLETIREFGSARLTDARREETEEAHATYFLGLAERVAPELPDGSPPAVLNTLQDARGNVERAVAHFLRTGRRAEARRTAMAVGFLCGMRGPLAEGRSILESVIPVAAEEDTPADAAALLLAGRLASRQAAYVAANALLTRALNIAQTCGLDSLAARAMLCLGCASAERGLYGDAEAWFDLARPAARDARDWSAEARTIARQGMIAFVSGRVEEAIESGDEALSMLRTRGDGHGAAQVVLNLGEANRLSGRLEPACSQLRKALAAFTKMGDHLRAAQCELSLGKAACLEGRIDESFAGLSCGLATALELGDSREAIFALPYLAAVRSRQGDSTHGLMLWSAFCDAVGVGAVFLEEADRREIETLADSAWPALKPAAGGVRGGASRPGMIDAIATILPSYGGLPLA